MTTNHEVELKLDIHGGDPAALERAPLLADSACVERSQLATYFDTPGQDLRAAGLSLRVREADGRFVQTVKASHDSTAGLFARREWEREVAGAEPEIDDSLPLGTLLPAGAIEAIRPAFTVQVTRRQWQVRYGDTDVEIVADMGNVLADGRTSPVSELELELKCGSPAALFALARNLGRSAPLRLGVLTKSERGYRVLAGADGKVSKAEAPALARGTSTADAFAAIVASCTRQFRLNEDCLRQGAQPDALHQARVALRRLRSALSMFRPVIDDAEFPRFREELRWLAATLGEARDLDVLIERLGGRHAERLGQARDRAYASAQAALESERARWLLIDLTEWTAIGAWRKRADGGAAAEPAEYFAAAVLDRLRRRIKRRGRALAALTDEQRHRARIDTKKLRYAADFFAPLFTGGKPARRQKKFLAALEELQQHLGDLNDLATAPAVLARLGIEEDVPASPDGRRDRLIEQASQAHLELVEAKRFWR